MNKPEVHVLRTGTANLASVTAAIERSGAVPLSVNSPDDVRSARLLILPGVGSFAAARKNLEERGLVEAVRTRIESCSPTLAICLGMQIVAVASEENPGVPGLGVFPGKLEAFPRSVAVPQLGWNTVRAATDSRYLTTGSAYFANSYRLVAVPEGWTPSFSDHGGPFVAALERGAVLLCQFHPELSGEWGARVLASWIECGVGEEVESC